MQIRDRRPKNWFSYFHYSQYLGMCILILAYQYICFNINLKFFDKQGWYDEKNKMRGALHFLWLDVDVVICYFWFYWHWNCPFNCHTQIWFVSLRLVCSVRYNSDQFNSFQVPTYWKMKMKEVTSHRVCVDYTVTER